MFSGDSNHQNVTDSDSDIFLTDSSLSNVSFHSTALPLNSALDSTFSLFPKNFNIVHINAQSIPSHYSDLLTSFESKNIHAILVSESFLKPSLPSTSYCLPGYHLIRNDRTGKGGGGVAIYLRSQIPFRILDKSPSLYSESSEYLLIEVLFGPKKVLLGVFYSPSLHINYFETFENLLEQHSSSVDHTIIMGDFNTCIIKNDHRARRLMNIIDSSNLTLLPTHATHFFPNCLPSQLDLMFVSTPSMVEAHGQLPAEAFSYHDLVYMSFKIRPPKVKPSIVMRRSFRNFDNDKFMEDLNNIDWLAVFDAPSIDDKLNIFNTLLTDLFDIHAPLRPIKIKHLPAPWLTNDIRALMVKRNAAKCKFKMYPTEANLLKYKKLRNRCSRICRDAQRKYIHSSVDQKDSGKTWQFLASLGIGRQRQLVSHFADLDSLNRHFADSRPFDALIKQGTLNHLSDITPHGGPELQFSACTTSEVRKHILAVKSDAIGSDGISRKMIVIALDVILPVLCHIFNYSLSSGSFPSAWVIGYIIPIPKVSNPSSPSQFRPISILPFLSKVLERIVYQQLSVYLNRYDLLTNLQSGFRRGHSTATALIKVCDDIRYAVDNKLLTVIVLLDFSNAFNTVDFDLLLAILRTMKVSPIVISWFRSYLFHRKQCVRLDDKFSTFTPLHSGVPQGGVLSPLLFSIYINSISSIISSSYHLYADDLQIYASAAINNLDVAIDSLNADLNKISAWCRSYGLSINPGKSQVTIIGSNYYISLLSNYSIPPVLLDGTAIPLSSAVKDLGLILDNTLSWVPQISELSRKIFAAVGCLRRWNHFLPVKTKILLANTLLLPILDYADVCYLDLSETMLNKLDRMQNLCIRFIYGLRKYDHVSEFRTQLKWLPIRSRRNLHALSLLYSILYYPQTPPYLKERFNFLGSYDVPFCLRSRNDNKLKVPHSHTGAYGNSFTIKAVLLWNELPRDIRQSKSLNIFKSRVKEYYLSNML